MIRFSVLWEREDPSSSSLRARRHCTPPWLEAPRRTAMEYTVQELVVGLPTQEPLCLAEQLIRNYEFINHNLMILVAFTERTGDLICHRSNQAQHMRRRSRARWPSLGRTATHNTINKTGATYMIMNYEFPEPMFRSWSSPPHHFSGL